MIEDINNSDNRIDAAGAGDKEDDGDGYNGDGDDVRIFFSR